MEKIAPVEELAEHDQQFIAALEQIKRCAEVALTQGSLSRRRSLREIEQIAHEAQLSRRGRAT